MLLALVNKMEVKDDTIREYIEKMNRIREDHRNQKLLEKQQKKEQAKKEAFEKKQREGKFDINPKSRPAFKLGVRRNTEEFDNRVFLKSQDIDGNQLFRSSHLLPRSYRFPSEPFKLTKNKGNEFGNPPESLLSKHGKATLQTRRQTFETEVEKRRQNEMKPKVVEFGPKWEYPKTHAGFFSQPPVDEYNYYKYQVKPEFYQEAPLRRTSKYGNLFSYP